MSDQLFDETLIRRLKSKESVDWYSLPKHIEAAREVMSEIDLDPASCELANETVKAARYYTIENDGLIQDWHAISIWLNPPYCGNQSRWVNRLIAEYEQGHVKQAILLVNAATEAAWFQHLYGYTVCFVSGRISFRSPKGRKNSPTVGSVFVYFGNDDTHFIRVFSQFGTVVRRVNTIHEIVQYRLEENA
jgi:ParB family chromosome partitioning protein